MKKLQVTRYSLAELEVLLKQTKDAIVRERLVACIQIAKGATSRELQSMYYHSHSRFCQWVNKLNAEGIAGLANKARKGKAAKLSQAQLIALKHILLEQKPGQQGYNSATWTGAMIRDYVEKNYGVIYKRSSIYVVLEEKLGLSYQKGKGFYPEAEQAKGEAFIEHIKKDVGS